MLVHAHNSPLCDSGPDRACTRRHIPPLHRTSVRVRSSGWSSPASPRRACGCARPRAAGPRRVRRIVMRAVRPWDRGQSWSAHRRAPAAVRTVHTAAARAITLSSPRGRGRNAWRWPSTSATCVRLRRRIRRDRARLPRLAGHRPLPNRVPRRPAAGAGRRAPGVSWRRIVCPPAGSATPLRHGWRSAVGAVDGGHPAGLAATRFSHLSSWRGLLRCRFSIVDSTVV